MRSARISTVAALLLCGSSAAVTRVVAQESAETAGILACARIESAVARLDCYDELAKRAAERSGGAQSRSGLAPAVAPPVESAGRVPSREERGTDRSEEELTGQVAALREIQPGRLEATLTNGQVWRQTNSDRYNLAVGHEVRIYPSSFGQYYRLSSKELRRFVQVERVR